MADTQRWTQPGWGPEDPEWYPHLKAESPKHQRRDRKSLVYRHQFRNHTRNSRYNLLQKIDDLKLEEALE